MLGMSRWSPTCLAREETGASDWAGDIWMRAAELMKTALQNEDCGVATVILRERAERWKEEQSGVELNEYDWGGRILAEIEKMGGRSLAERFADRSTDWRQIRPELRQAVRGEEERRQEARTKELKKRQEEGMQPWCKDWRTARNSLTTQEVEYVEKARTGSDFPVSLW